MHACMHAWMNDKLGPDANNSKPCLRCNPHNPIRFRNIRYSILPKRLACMHAIKYIYIYMHDCKFSMRELLCVKTLMHEHGCAHSSSLSWLGARAARVAMVWLMDGSCTRFLRNIQTCMYICSWEHLNSWSTALPAPNAELCTQRPGNTWQTDQGWQLRVSNK